jgi:hypothetical protein
MTRHRRRAWRLSELSQVTARCITLIACGAAIAASAVVNIWIIVETFRLCFGQ